MFAARLLCLLLVSTAALASDLRADLKRQADAWDAAIVKKDKAAIAANMADDFRHISERGSVADRAAFLENIVSPKLTIEPYTVEDFDVRIYGDVALVSGTTRMKGSWDGKPFKSNYRYTDVYVRRDGAWKVASVQISPMPE